MQAQKASKLTGDAGTAVGEARLDAFGLVHSVGRVDLDEAALGGTLGRRVDLDIGVVVAVAIGMAVGHVIVERNGGHCVELES